MILYRRVAYCVSRNTVSHAVAFLPHNFSKLKKRHLTLLNETRIWIMKCVIWHSANVCNNTRNKRRVWDAYGVAKFNRKEYKIQTRDHDVILFFSKKKKKRQSILIKHDSWADIWTELFWVDLCGLVPVRVANQKSRVSQQQPFLDNNNIYLISDYIKIWLKSAAIK